MVRTMRREVVWEGAAVDVAGMRTPLKAATATGVAPEETPSPGVAKVATPTKGGLTLPDRRARVETRPPERAGKARPLAKALVETAAILRRALAMPALAARCPRPEARP